MAAFSFIQPPGTHLAGGGAYITGLIAALRAAGHEAVVQTDLQCPAGHIAVIDGLALPAFAPDAIEGAVGLIHHTAALAGADTKPAIRAAERILLPRLRRVVATSEAVGARLTDAFGVLPDRLTVITPGVPDVPRCAGSGREDCAILSVGALVPRKGHAVLLRALARLLDLDWRLTIVGDDQRDPVHTAMLHDIAAAAGIAARVTFAGPVADLEPFWRGADLFALATEWEGHAASVAEALRRGLPVAVTAGGAAAEGIPPDAGVVVQPGDSDGLSKAMRRLIFDVPLRTEMSQAAWMAGQELPRWINQAARFVEATI